MTVSSEVTVAGPYDGNGITTVFPFEFRIVNEKHLRVVLRDPFGISTDLYLDDGDYSVSGVGSDNGNVTVAVAPLVGYKLTILRNPPFTQETDLTNQGPYSAEVVENRFDLLVMQIQAVNEKAERAYAVEPGQTPPSLDLVVSAEQNAAAAAQSASDSSDAAMLAARFANEAEDVEVTPGLFSAYHWMRKTLAIYNAVANTLAGWIHGATAKDLPVDADEIGIADSAAAFGLKKMTLTALLAWLGPAIGLDVFVGCVPSKASNTSVAFTAGAGFFGGKKLTLPAYTKLLNAVFAAGNNAGMLDTGVMQASKTYFLHAIRNTANGAGDYLASTSLTAPTVPAGWEKLSGSRVGIVVTNSSTQIISFEQIGNEVYTSQVLEGSQSTDFDVANFQPGSLPAGISIDYLLMFITSSPASQTTKVIATGAVGFTSGPSVIGGGVSTVASNVQAGQVVRSRPNGVRLSGTVPSGGVAQVYSCGWIDYTCTRWMA